MASCESYREALSARADGEPAGVAPQRLDAHLAVCAECRALERTGHAVDEAVRRTRSPQPRPDRTHELLTAMRAGEATGPVADDGRAARAALAAVAVVQLVLVVSELLAGVPGHAARDLGAFEIALAVGFLTAAAAPERAATLLPMSVALVGALAVIVAVDLATGRAAPVVETAHAAEVVGVVLLWRVTRPATGVRPRATP